MNQQISKSRRRLAVVINYLCIALFLILFNIGVYYGWSIPVIAGVIVSVAVAMVSFIVLHVKTHLWKLVHTKADKLDERQIQVTHESLRYSYGIFSVISLLVLMCTALIVDKYDSGLIMIFACLLYLAHTLPASVIAWTEKEV
ncbi:MAG: hypothetical protein U9R56_02340 [candidate division Zixibacteria bacterium]|nr:hypothetical protein [candidate division Zixibacteria bacterium]